jgi:hypothetical protein
MFDRDGTVLTERDRAFDRISELPNILSVEALFGAIAPRKNAPSSRRTRSSHTTPGKKQSRRGMAVERRRPKG